ncbi:universal stress protein [Streptomyces sp. NPDC007369]|uniref:universal stress protein n=1 Tax=Streptomyces sp. NPDC007369 TaxID=3154589 RepID=UPI0033E7B359
MVGAVRHQRVVTGVSGSPGSMTALHRAAAEARLRDAELWVVLAWQAPGGAGPLGRHFGGAASPTARCRAAAVEQLRSALEAAFGAVRPGVTLAGLTVRGTPGAALVDAVRDADDLIVVGTGSRTLIQWLRPSVARYCQTHAPCPVLTVPPSPLQAELVSVHRRNFLRLPLDLRELAS